ncbi:hypothetical protein PtB15_9B76 [Puccinia triticina]|nr:hypothetical protein PtB15_9B76 [Puccinia triticina]
MSYIFLRCDGDAYRRIGASEERRTGLRSSSTSARLSLMQTAEARFTIIMSGYGYNQGYNGHPTGGFQQNQQPYPPQQHPTQGGYQGQPCGQYGQPAPQNYGNAPGGGYQAQPA